jgi:hypothetical protein
MLPLQVLINEQLAGHALKSKRKKTLDSGRTSPVLFSPLETRHMPTLSPNASEAIKTKTIV